MSAREVKVIAVALVAAALLVAGIGVVRSDAASYPRPEVVNVQTKCPGADVGIVVDGNPRLLTHDENSYDPLLSPDERSIVFTRGDPATITSQYWGRSQLWVMSANGESAHPLTEMSDHSDFGRLVWTPDSRSVAYVTRHSLMRIDVATGTTSVMLDGIDTEKWAHWNGEIFAFSPDGARIVTGGKPTIIDLLDGSQARLADGEFRWGDEPTWSPDGEWVVMTARSRVTTDPEGGLWAYHVDGGVSWRISENTNVSYEWAGPDELFNVRDGEGDTQTAYLSDLSERRSTPVEVPEERTPFPGELDACAR